MKTEDLQAFLHRFQEALAPIFERIEIAPLPSIEGRWLDNKGEILEDRHGIYFFALKDGRVVYIGKADKSSLAKRVWDHVSTPSKERHDLADRKGIVIYPDVEWAEDEEYGEKMKYGEFVVYAYEVRPKYYSSLLEVATQVFCEKNGSRPALNKQIG